MITQKRLRELAHYCPETGQFTHLKSKGRKKAGVIAGSLRRDGYVYVMFDGHRTMAHRFAWLYMTGEWPAKEIDHVDGNKANNAFVNLRQVNRRMNTENQRSAKRTSVTGLLGVRSHGRKFVSTITSHGERHYLGSFDTAIEAHEAYVQAKRLIHNGCTI